MVRFVSIVLTLLWVTFVDLQTVIAACGDNCTCWADLQSTAFSNCQEEGRSCASGCAAEWKQSKAECVTTRTSTKNSCDSAASTCIAECDGDAACLTAARCTQNQHNCRVEADDSFRSCDNALGSSAPETCGLSVCGLAKMSCADFMSYQTSYDQCRAEEKAREAEEKARKAAEKQKTKK